MPGIAPGAVLSRAGRLLTSLGLWLVVAVVLAIAGAGVLYAQDGSLRESGGPLRTSLRPAQVDVGRLTVAYLDQETGLRGFTLTGEESYLQPYVAASARSVSLRGSLTELLDGYPRAAVRLERTVALHARWQREADRLVQRVRAGGAVVDQAALTTAFDRLRDEVDLLEEEVSRQVDVAVGRFARAQDRARLAAGLAIGLAAASLLLGGVVVHLLVRRPLRGLVDQISAVSAGSWERPVVQRWPLEARVIAEAADSMRTSILRRSQDLVEAHRELGVRSERERVAADLHDLTVQRVFAIGLGLDLVAQQHPEVADQLAPYVGETDRAVSELRAVIYALADGDDLVSLCDRLQRLADEAGRPLGFTPAVSTTGPTHAVPAMVCAEVMAVARESLSNVARHARATAVTIELEVTADQVRLHVADDGRGLPERTLPGHGLVNIRRRAERLRGTAEVTSAPGQGTVVRWRVPLDPPHPVEDDPDVPVVRVGGAG